MLINNKYNYKLNTTDLISIVFMFIFCLYQSLTSTYFQYYIAYNIQIIQIKFVIKKE